MDFNSLGANALIHIIRKKPFGYVVGNLKSKGNIPQSYIPAIPQKIDLTVTVNGIDEIVPGVPANVDAVEYGNSYYCITEEGALQAVTKETTAAKARIENHAYDESVIEAGEKIHEQLNPRYAEEKRQARTIEELVKHRKETDAQLKDLSTQNKEMLSMLRELCGDGSKSSKSK